MVKGQKKLKLGRKASHKNALLKNMVRSLFSNGYLTTTTIKAKALRMVGLKLLNDLKENSATAKRRAQEVLGNKKLVEVAVEYLKNEKTGIKVLKVGFRPGDMAQTSRVSLIGFNTKTTKSKKDDKKEESKEKEVKSEGNRLVNTLNNVTKKVNTKSIAKTERSRTRSGL